MNWHKQLTRLATRARYEDLPIPAVSEKVLNRLQRPTPTMALLPEQPLMWMAGLSSIAAVALVVLAISLYNGVASDPLTEVFETVSWASAP